MIQNQTRAGKKQRIPQSRRHFLQAAGTAGLIGVAGCAGDGETPSGGTTSNNSDGTSNDSDGGSGGKEMVDAEFIAASWTDLNNVQWNPYHPQNFPGAEAGMVFDQIGQFRHDTAEFFPHAAEWSLGKEQVEIALNDRTWHNGDPVTARDLATQFQMDKITGHPMWDHVSSLDIEDKTVRLNLEGPKNQNVISEFFLDASIQVPHSRYKKYLELFNDASTESEREKAQEALIEYTPREPLGNGLYKIATQGNQRMALELYEDHPVADQLNFSQYTFRTYLDNNSRWQAAKGDKIDGHSTFSPPDVVEEFPEHWIEQLYPGMTDYTLAFQHDHPLFGQLKVRQAFAYILDRKSISETIGPHREPVEYPLGTGYIGSKAYFSEEMKRNLHPYERDPEKAASLLREAGFTKDNGNWMTPSGDRFSLDLRINSGWSDWVQGTQVLASQLSQFGIDASMITMEGAQFYEFYSSGDFAVIPAHVGSWGGRHPYFDYRVNFVPDNFNVSYNFPTEVSIPMPPGDPEGSKGSINVEEKTNELINTSSEEKEKELLMELAWAFNQTIPKLHVSYRVGIQSFLATDTWEVPPEDDRAMNVDLPYLWLPKAGKISAKR